MTAIQTMPATPAIRTASRRADRIRIARARADRARVDSATVTAKGIDAAPVETSRIRVALRMLTLAIDPVGKGHPAAAAAVTTARSA